MKTLQLWFKFDRLDRCRETFLTLAQQFGKGVAVTQIL